MDLNLKNKHPRRIYYLFLVIIFFFGIYGNSSFTGKELISPLNKCNIGRSLGADQAKGRIFFMVSQ